MTVTAPTSLADALAALADEPGSLVLAGGTDLMVQVNEGLRRPGPAPVLALAGVPELRAVRREGDDLVVGAGATYTELMARAGRELGAGAGPGRPHRRLAADPQRRARSAATSAPRRRRATRCRCSSRSARPSSWRAPTGARVRCPIGEFLTGPKATALEPGELIVGVRDAGAARAAGVPEGRRAQRDGDRGGVGGDGRRPRRAARSASGSARSGRPRSRAPDACAWLRPRDWRDWHRRRRSPTSSRDAWSPRRSPDRRPPQSPPRTGGTPSACWRDARCAGAPHDR